MQRIWKNHGMKLALSGLLILLLGLAAGKSVGLDLPLLAPETTLDRSFTYQGSLQNNGMPADGNFDFRFALFDALENGAQVGGTVEVTAVSVVDGRFTTTLDFGDVFDGTALYLQLEVKADGEPGYTILTPRQPLTAAPYASFALNANTADTATHANTAFSAERANVVAKPGHTTTVLGYDPRDMQQYPGTKPSMLIGWDGLPLVAYVQPGANASVQLARCQDSACTDYGTDEIYAPQTPVVINGRISLNLTPDGTYHLAFLDNNTLQLRSQCFNAPCGTSYAGASMQAMAAMIGIDGLPIIAYIDMNDNLKALHCGDLFCNTTLADTIIEPFAGSARAPDITIGPNGHPIIAYIFDAVSGPPYHHVKAAHCQDIACTQVEVVFTESFGTNIDEDQTTQQLTTAHDGEVRIAILSTFTVSLKTYLHVKNLSGDTVYEFQPDHYLDASQAITYDLALTTRPDNTFFTVLNTVGWYQDNPPGNDVLFGSGLVALGGAQHGVDTHFFLDETITDTKIAATVGVDGLPVIAYVNSAGNLVFIHCGNTMCASYFRVN